MHLRNRLGSKSSLLHKLLADRPSFVDIFHGFHAATHRYVPHGRSLQCSCKQPLCRGSAHCRLESLKGQVGAIAPLVADGENVNGLQDGVTPLGIACGKGNQHLVEALLENKADPNMKTGTQTKKELPLGIAAYAQNYNLGVVQALLQAKANPEAKDDYEYSALLYARMRQRTVIADEMEKYLQ